MLSQRRETLSQEESRTLKYVLFFLSFSGIENGLSGNFAQTYMIFKKIIFFIPKTTPPFGRLKYLKILSKSIVRFFLRIPTRSIVHPRKNVRPLTIEAAGILVKTEASAFLSAIQRHCPRPMDSRYCPRLADVHRTRTRAGALANWSM